MAINTTSTQLEELEKTSQFISDILIDFDKDELIGDIKNENINDEYELYDQLDYSGHLHSLIDSSIDLYNYDLRAWAVENYYYIELAMEEGFCEGVTDFHRLIQCGQYMMYSDIMRQDVHDLFNVLNDDDDN